MLYMVGAKSKFTFLKKMLRSMLHVLVGIQISSEPYTLNLYCTTLYMHYCNTAFKHHAATDSTNPLLTSLIPWPLPDFISQPWRKIGFSPQLRDKIWEWPGNKTTAYSVLACGSLHYGISNKPYTAHALCIVIQTSYMHAATNSTNPLLIVY